MVNEFHLYFGKYPTDKCIHTVNEVEEAISEHKDVHTTQVDCADMMLLDNGYRIFIHPFEGDIFEITLGDCANTSRNIRLGHNLPRLLIAGEFDTDTTNVTGR